MYMLCLNVAFCVCVCVSIALFTRLCMIDILHTCCIRECCLMYNVVCEYCVM